MNIRAILPWIPFLCLPTSAFVQSAIPTTQPLTPTVGVNIVKLTPNPDHTMSALFRWKDKDNNDVERSVFITPSTVIGIHGQLKTMSDLTDDVIHSNKAVATVGPDMVTAVSLRVGREMIHVTKDQLSPPQIAALEAAAPKPTAASDEALTARVSEWVGALNLKDPGKTNRVKAIIITHLKNVRDAHNAGFAPAKSSHEDFNQGLAAELTPDQIGTIKNDITINKVSFTFNAYHAIVPNLTPEEDAKILDLLKAAREESLDYKNPDEMSRVFERYKTQIENYLNAHGHDWRALYKAYTQKQKSAQSTPPTQ